jgi:hypothetical protein
MGIIILPFLVLAFLAFLKSISLIYKSAKVKDIEAENYFFGTLITLIIYFLIYLNYKSNDSAIALGAYFMFPFFMIITPYIIGMSLKNSNEVLKKKLMQILLISVISSSIFIVIFYKYTFGIIELLGLHKTF